MRNDSLAFVPWQEEVAGDTNRYKTIVAGRRSGKTTLARIEAAKFAIFNPNTETWICCLTFGQAYSLYFTPLIKLIPKIWVQSISKSTLTINLVNGSSIHLKGTKNIDSLLGNFIDFLILDEWQSHDCEAVWGYLSPMLADTKGKVLAIGTPRGMGNDLYSFYMNGQGKAGWNSWQIKTEDAGTIDAEEIQAAKDRMSPKMFRQEFQASFEASSGLVYSDFSPELNSTTRVLDKGKPLLIGMDFNVSPMTAVVCQRDGTKLYILEEIYLEDSNTQEMADAINNKYPEWRSRIVIYPDPAGRARSTKARFNDTDHSILRNAGLTLNVLNKAPFIADRINVVNGLIMNANGDRRLFINNKKCPQMDRTLRGLVYDEKTQLPDKQGGLDHMSDGLGYLVWTLWGQPRTMVGTF